MDGKQAARPSFLQKLGRGKTRGIALFEVIIALGILGVIITGAVLLLQGAQERIARNETLQLINQVRAEANRIWASQPTYAGLEIHVLAQSGGLPDYVWRDAQTSGTGFGVYDAADNYLSTYEEAIDVWGSTTLKQFTLGLDNLDPGPCVDILSSWAEKTRAVAGIVSAGVFTGTAGLGTGPTWTAAGVPGSATAMGSNAPFSTADVATWCAGGAGGNDIYIRFQG